jgi:hypothetical protein
MNINPDFSHAIEFITECTEIKPMENFFLGQSIKPYFDVYIEKYYGDDRKKREPKQIGTYQEIYKLIESKQDVINRQNFTEKMFTDYKIKFDRGDCNKGHLENAVIDIEIAFSQYIIALRKLISINSKEYKCSIQETKDFILAGFRYEKEISQLKSNILMMD